MVRAAPLFHGNYGVATDSRLDLRVRDGRRELLRSSERYDVITLEPPPPSAMGVVNLYSRDFYALAGHRLTANGLLAQWWPLATQNDEDSRAMVRAFLDAFPYASLWTTELHEMLLLGSPEPIELDAARIGARFDHPEVAAALGEVGIGFSGGAAGHVDRRSRRARALRIGRDAGDRRSPGHRVRDVDATRRVLAGAAGPDGAHRSAAGHQREP